MSSSQRHPTWSMAFRERASLPGTSPLAAYLLRLMTLKRTNLCLSADVSTTAELLELAEECGDSICLLKTHADAVADFGERAIRGLRAIALKKHFLIFEDRKFADIGETVRKQYTSGPLRIARWAEITNAHILPGPAIVDALRDGASAAIAQFHANVSTEIRASPRTSASPSAEQSEDEAEDEVAIVSPPLTGGDGGKWDIDESGERLRTPTAFGSAAGRKPSVVSVSTTISTRTENISPQPTPNLDDIDPFPHYLPNSSFSNLPSSVNNPGAFVPFKDPPGDLRQTPTHDPQAMASRLARLGAPPILRGLLLLAEMSSAGNYLTPEYTAAAVELARVNADFVMGFIAQRALNALEGDNFVTMTPGAKLPPPEGASGGGGGGDRGAATGGGATGGDALGQQYNHPRALVRDRGCDVVIVGRGILAADERGLEAERYRAEAWAGYEERVRMGMPGAGGSGG